MLAGVKRATEIVDMGNVTPEEWEMAKIEVSKRKVMKKIAHSQFFRTTNARFNCLKNPTHEKSVVASILILT